MCLEWSQFTPVCCYLRETECILINDANSSCSPRSIAVPCAVSKTPEADAVVLVGQVSGIGRQGSGGRKVGNASVVGDSSSPACEILQTSGGTLNWRKAHGRMMLFDNSCQ